MHLRFRLKFCIIAAAFLLLIVIGCTGIRRHLQHSPVARHAQHPHTYELDQLDQADEYAWLGNWKAAYPIYKELELRFTAQGDKRNALYAHISRLREEEEYTNHQTLSLYLASELKNPMVQHDPYLLLRLLEVKGKVDLNLDGISAGPSFSAMEKLARRVGYDDLASRASGELGIVAFLSGDQSQAKRRVSRAIASAFLSGDIGAEIRYLSLMGAGLAENHRYPEALFCANRAISVCNSTPACGFPETALVGKAEALTELNRFPEANDVIMQGMAYARRHGYIGYEVDMLAQAGELAAKQNNIAEAIHNYEEAAERARRIHLNRGLAEITGQLASLYQSAGNFPIAERYADQSVLAHKALGEIYILPHHLAIEAQLQAQAGDLKAAEATFTAAEDFVETILVHSATPALKKTVVASMSEIFLDHFELAATSHDLPRAYSIIERVRGRVAADRMQSSRPATLPNHTSEDSETERRISLVQMKILDARTSAERQTVADELGTLETELVSGEADVSLPGRYEGASLNALQDVLAPGELFLEYILSDRHSYCLAITRNNVSLVPLPKRELIDTAVERYTSQIKTGSTAELQAQARTLSATVFAGVPIDNTVSSLTIVPDGSLHRVPFAALYDRDGNLVLEKRSVSYAPSGKVLTALRRMTDHSANSMFAVGAVQYNEVSRFAVWNEFAKTFRGLSTLNRDQLLPLPGTAEELKTIKVLFGHKVITMSGSEATEGQFKRTVVARPFSVIHLAVHAFADRNYPDRAGMLFAPESKAGEKDGNDGILQLPEIRDLPLRMTTLVTLSACDTNVGRTEGEEGLSSIVQSFLYAGAKSAVATLWMTEDMSTSALMTRFYQHLATGESTREALRHSQLEMIHGGGDWRSPFYWAAFTLNGDGGRAIP